MNREDQVMRYIQVAILSLSLSTLSTSVWSVNVYECEDEQGNRTFQDRCPPGTKRIDKKQYSTRVADSDSTQQNLGPLTLYLVPNCDTCEQVKEFLDIRNISFTEKDVNENVKLQEELKEKNNGDLRVPLLLIGDKAISGYNRSTLISALEEAGYTKEDD